MERKKEIGDLVACYLTNTDEYDKLLEVGIVIDINNKKNSILVVTSTGNRTWWNKKRWRVLQKNLSKERS